jgi:hypothetical protein
MLHGVRVHPIGAADARTEREEDSGVSTLSVYAGPASVHLSSDGRPAIS